MAEKKLRSSGKGRGWNFKKGAKDELKPDEAVLRGAKGGEARVPKGFADPEVQLKGQIQRKVNQEFADDGEKQ